MSAVTQWFDIEDFRPCQYGVYEMENDRGYRRAYSLFNGEWRTANYTVEGAAKAYTIIAAVGAGSYLRWRGLSEKPE